MTAQPVSSLAKGTLLLIATLTVLAGAIIAPSLPRLVEKWISEGMDHDKAQFWGRLLLSIPAFFMMFCAPLMGYVIDKFGRLRVLFTGLVFYAITGVCGGISQTLLVLVISRSLLGIAVSMTMTSSMTLAGDYLHGFERQRFFGMFGSAMSFGGIIYFIIGGISADYDWRAPFFIYLFSFVPFLIALFALHEPLQKEEVHYGEKGTQKLNVPILVLLYLTALVNMGMYYIVPMQLPFVLQELGNSSAFYTGLFSAFCSIGVVITSFQYSRIRTILTPSQVFAAGFFLMGVGFILFATFLKLYVMGLSLFISGCGLGLIMPNNGAWLMSVTPSHIRGRIMGGLTSSINLGQFLSPILVYMTQKHYGNIGVYHIFGLFALGVCAFYVMISMSKHMKSLHQFQN